MKTEMQCMNQVPAAEPERQQYFIKLVREQVEALSRKKDAGSPVLSRHSDAR